MLIAVLASFLNVLDVNAAARPHSSSTSYLPPSALIVGAGASWWKGRTVKLTAMPQMVALYNGMGGGAAGAIAAVELVGRKAEGATLIVALIGGLIGAVSLSGSLIAWAKLDEILKKPLRFKGQRVINATVFVVTIATAGYMVFTIQDGPRCCSPFLHRLLYFSAADYSSASS